MVLSLTLVSCGGELTIKNDDNFKPMPVVSCIIEPNYNPKVYVTETKSTDDSSFFDKIKTSDLTITNAEQILTTFKYIPALEYEIGYYSSIEKVKNVQENSEFKIEATINGQRISAIERLPKVPEIKSIKIIQDSLIRRDIDNNRFRYILGALIEIVFDKVKVDEIYQFEALTYNDTFTNLFGTSRDSSYSKAASLSFENYEEPLFFNSFIVNPNLESSKRLLIRISTSIDSRKSIPKDLKISVKALSPNYYKYLQDLTAIRTSNQNPFVSVSNVYSNINNGRGIFTVVNSVERDLTF